MTTVPTPVLQTQSWRDIPRGVWALGFVSMFMDISSEMIHALLPIYLVTALGASMVTVGFIEGAAEATAMITKVFSGAISDWLGKRKLLAVIGYGLAAFTKPVFPLANSVGWIVGARFVDRVGKGIRGAPRDALVADIAPEHVRGASFGMRQSLDTIGAFAGPLLAIGQQLHHRVLDCGRPWFYRIRLDGLRRRGTCQENGTRKHESTRQASAPVERRETIFTGVLGGCGCCKRIHAGALQRSLSHSQGASRGRADCVGANRHGGHECRLRHFRVSGRRVVRPLGAQRYFAFRYRHADCGRCHIGVCTVRRRCDARRHVLGS